MKTKLMGVLNITPDSFYEQSRNPLVDQAIETALRLQSEGADILDIGGESSRPGAPSVGLSEELNRVIPVLEALKGKLSIPISIDTTKPAVAQAAFKAGATLLNDISCFSDPDMISLASKEELDVCIMHMQGTPRTMQLNPHYEEGIIPHLLQWFEKKVDLLTRQGIDPKKIILDPGIGYGKTVAHNLEIIHNLAKFKRLGFRILVGASRKSFLSRILNKPPEELLPATVAINVIAMISHVDIIRVHDVKEHRSVVDIMKAYLTHHH